MRIYSTALLKAIFGNALIKNFFAFFDKGFRAIFLRKESGVGIRILHV